MRSVAKESGQRGTWRWALAASVGVLFLAVSVQKIWPGDFWGQLRTGQWILEHGKLPTADDYSFTAAGREVREVRWLFCVLVALGWKVGPWVLCVGQAVVLGVMWGVLAWSARRALGSPWAWAVLALAMAGGAGRWVLRPELATDLFLVVFLVLLERARVRGKVGAAWWLVAAQVLWVNAHSVYVFGPVLAWMFAGSVAVEGIVAARAKGGMLKELQWERVGTEAAPWRERAQGMALLALGVTAACWVNPYFHRGAVYALEMWREAGGLVGEMLGEMRSPLTIPIAIWRWDLWCAAVLTVVAVGTYVLNWRRVGPARLGVLVIAMYLGATMQRNLPILAVLTAWGGLMNLVDLHEAGWRGVVGTGRLRAARGVVAAAVGVGSMGLAWYVATDRAWVDINAPRETGIGVVEWDLPTGATDFVVSSGCRPQVYNHMREGHYLGWRSEGKIKVFVDGRTDVYGDDFLREYMSTGAGTWDAISTKRGINTAVLPVRGYESLIDHLRRHAGWALVYLDHRNLVFVRRIPEHSGLIAAHAIDPRREWVAPTPEPEELVEGWKRRIGGKARPWYTFGLAQSFLAVGSTGNAERYLRRTLDRFPGHERAIAELAAIERSTGREEQGAARLATLPRGSVWRGYSERVLALYLDESGRREAAIEAMERALASGETEAASRVVLGDWYFSAGNLAAAGRQYEAAARAGHETAAEWKKLGYVRERGGDDAGAAKAYERSLELDPGQHEVWYLLGVVRNRRGERPQAREALATAVRLKPDYVAARRALEAMGR